MSNNARRLGIVSADRYYPIPRDLVAVERRPATRFQPAAVVAIDASGIDRALFPANAVLDVVVKDSETNARDHHEIGPIHEIDRSNIRCPIGTTVSGRNIGVFLQVVDPVTKRILGGSERFGVPADNSNVEGAGNDAEAGSPVEALVDADETLPMSARVEEDGPTIVFGRLGPSSTVEAGMDPGCLRYGLPFAMKEFVRAMLEDEDGILCSARWTAFKGIVAEGCGHPDWASLLEASVGKSAATAAHDVVVLYVSGSVLEGMIKAIMENAAHMGAAGQE